MKGDVDGGKNSWRIVMSKRERERVRERDYYYNYYLVLSNSILYYNYNWSIKMLYYVREDEDKIFRILTDDLNSRKLLLLRF